MLYAKNDAICEDSFRNEPYTDGYTLLEAVCSLKEEGGAIFADNKLYYEEVETLIIKEIENRNNV